MNQDKGIGELFCNTTTNQAIKRVDNRLL